MRYWRALLQNSLIVCLLLSLLIHAGIWLGLRLTEVHTSPKRAQKIEVTILDKSPAVKRLELHQQIVQQPDQAINNEVKPNAKYLSAHNQLVIHQTRARNFGAFRNTDGTGGNDYASRNRQRIASHSLGATRNSKLRLHTRGKLPTLADLSPRFNPTQIMNFDNNEVGNGVAPSQTDDYLKNTTPSLETLLSTKQFIYYTYYQRIRSRIRQYWAPCVRKQVLKIFAEGRTIASTEDHITRVIIVLDRNGNLVKVEVVGQSGIKELDDAAVEAFREAAPFPHPPKGIVGRDGYIRINWDFIRQADNSSPMVLKDLFAYR